MLRPGSRNVRPLEPTLKLTVKSSDESPFFSTDTSQVYNWAFNYKHNEDRWNPPDLISKEPYLKDSSQKVVPPLRDPHPIPNGANVDIVMTHGPPWMHLDRCYNGYRAGCPQLLQALDRVRPLIHCFGHIHEAWGAERVVWKARTDGNEVQAAPERGKMGEVAEVLGSLEPPLGSPIQKPDGKDVIERGAAYVNVSKASPAPLRAGEETLLINSSIMSLRYAPINAGWLVDLELPIMSPKS